MPARSGRLCIVSKVDEAASLGPALDVVVRHGLLLAYAANGQRVPGMSLAQSQLSCCTGPSNLPPDARRTGSRKTRRRPGADAERHRRRWERRWLIATPGGPRPGRTCVACSVRVGSPHAGVRLRRRSHAGRRRWWRRRRRWPPQATCVVVVDEHRRRHPAWRLAGRRTDFF